MPPDHRATGHCRQRRSPPVGTWQSGGQLSWLYPAWLPSGRFIAAVVAPSAAALATMTDSTVDRRA